MNNKTKIIFSLIIICFLIISRVVHGQEQGDTLKAEDILQMSLYDLMHIKVVTASKTDQSIKDVAASMHIITAGQIRDRAYYTLEEALSDLPGFQFRNINGFNSYVFMRGAPSQNNLIILMVDGIQINELNSGGFYAGGQYNLSDVEQIEVVYGPASALYGTNAVSGIVNIITKKPVNNSGHVSILGGNFKTGMVNFDLARYFEDKDLGFSVSGQYKTTEKADLAGYEGDNNWTDNMENFENDLTLSGKLKIRKFNAGIVFQEKRSSRTTSFKSVSDTSLDKNTLWDIYFLNAFLKYSNNNNEKWSSVSTAYYRNSTVKPNTISQIVKSTTTSSGYQIGYYRPNHLLGLENQINYRPIKNLLLTGGLIGEAENLSDGYSVTYSSSQDATPPIPDNPPVLHNYLLSYYAQANYSFIEQISLNAGIRHDFSNYYGNVFIPRIGIVFNQDNFTAKALFNKAFRAPKPWDYNFGAGNSDLMPEKMRTLEFCLSYRLKEIIRLGGSVFNNIIEDKLTKEITATTERWTNNDMLTTTGFELYGDYLAQNLSIYTNYSFNDSRDQDDVFIPEISKHKVNVGFTWSFPDMLLVNLRVNYLGERKNPFIISTTGNDIIDDALVLNGCLSFTGIKRLNLQLKINNILNEKYFHPSNRFDGRYRQPQRTVLMIVSYNFDMKGFQDKR